MRIRAASPVRQGGVVDTQRILDQAHLCVDELREIAREAERLFARAVLRQAGCRPTTTTVATWAGFLPIPSPANGWVPHGDCEDFTAQVREWATALPAGVDLDAWMGAAPRWIDAGLGPDSAAADLALPPSTRATHADLAVCAALHRMAGTAN